QGDGIMAGAIERAGLKGIPQPLEGPPTFRQGDGWLGHLAVSRRLHDDPGEQGGVAWRLFDADPSAPYTGSVPVEHKEGKSATGRLTGRRNRLTAGRIRRPVALSTSRSGH